VRPSDFLTTFERSLRNPQSPATTYLAGLVGAKACLKVPKHCDLTKGVVADDRENIVTFHLVAPDPDFLHELALPYAYPLPPSTPAVAHGPVAATGPYEIASFGKGALRLVRNPHFREWSAAAQPNGYPNTIVERLNDTANGDVAAVEKDNADLALDAGDASPPVLRALATHHASRIEVSPKASTIFFFLDTRAKPFDDVRVRRALNYAVDRSKLLTLWGGPDLGQITCQILPSNFAAYKPYCPYTVSPGSAGTWSAADLAKARALVAASGTKGQPVSVWVPKVLGGEGAYVASVLTSLGYKVRLQVVPHLGREMTAAAAGQVQVGGSEWNADFGAPSGFFVSALGCRAYVPGEPSGNPGGFCDPAIDREMTRARALQITAPEAADRLWRKIDRETVDQAPWVPFVNPRALEFLSDRVGNYQYNPQWGTLIDLLWVNSS
jgi:peptide/nickel transport system substrate-binding protein